jgi:hypothetical protein
MRQAAQGQSERNSAMIHMVFSRPRFFDGRLLTAQDLQAEQVYHCRKAQFRNLHLHGVGIVSGLRLRIGDDRTSLIVTPGYAIDGHGRDICVPYDIQLPIPSQVTRLSVWISHAEVESAPMPSLSSIDRDNLVMNSCTEEGFNIDFGSHPPRTGGPHPTPLPPSDQPGGWLLLGLVVRRGKTWRLDPRQPRPRLTRLHQRTKRTTSVR